MGFSQFVVLVCALSYWITYYDLTQPLKLLLLYKITILESVWVKWTTSTIPLITNYHTHMLTHICICFQEEQGMDLQSLNIESLEQLKYTGCVIKETLRINPPVPGGFRVALKTFELNVS